MKTFTALYESLDMTTSTNAKVAAMVDYFSAATASDAAWALYFLTGRRIKRLISSRMLRAWLLELTHMPLWLYEDAYVAVGDTSEAIALLLDTGLSENAGEELSLAEWMDQRILPLQGLDENDQKAQVVAWWNTMNRQELFMLNKLLLGGFRVGVSQLLVVRALAKVAAQPEATITHRLMGTWSPSAQMFENLLAESHEGNQISHPYPFYLASPMEQMAGELGSVDEWLMEWKWDGIRSQLIHRNSEVYLWSRGEELITERFPEIAQAAARLPAGTVLDGEVLAFENGQPLAFSKLQTRIGRKKLTKAVLDEAPAIFMAYDILEFEGRELRHEPLSDRRALLARLMEKAPSVFQLSPAVSPADWQEAAALRLSSREHNVEGLMLKRWSSVYQTGRKRGDWWKWKIDPYTVDAVLTTVQAGTGRRANLYTDYTLAVWQDDQLVPVAKAYSGLSDKEIRQMDQWIRKHTLDKFGPVRIVQPFHVFEIAFENIAASPRHKSGIALRFPRILRWRTDKKPEDADTLETLKTLLASVS